jgi:hypothetical protein
MTEETLAQNPAVAAKAAEAEVRTYTEEFASSSSLAKLAGALAKAKLTMPPKVKPNKVNTYYNSKYASLDVILEAIQKPLAENGLVLTQDAGTETLHTMLIHESGEWKSSRVRLMPKDKGLHGWGGANTYQKRFAISGMIGIATDEDDDGNSQVDPPSRGGNRSSGGGGDRPPAPQSSPPAEAGDLASLEAQLQQANNSQAVNKVAYALNQSVKAGLVSPQEANSLTEHINQAKVTFANS